MAGLEGVLARSREAPLLLWQMSLWLGQLLSFPLPRGGPLLMTLAVNDGHLLGSQRAS
jgi:hypothetical protein